MTISSTPAKTDMIVLPWAKCNKDLMLNAYGQNPKWIRELLN